MRKIILALVAWLALAPAFAQQGGNSNGFSSIVNPDASEGGVSVQINPFRENATERAGSMTVGGSWQQIAPVNPLRQRFFLQNFCSAQTQGIASSESIFLKITATMPTGSPVTTGGATELVTCGAYDTSTAVVGTAPVWVWAATVNHRFQALEW